VFGGFEKHIGVIANDVATKVDLPNIQFTASIRSGTIERVLDEFEFLGVDTAGWTHIYDTSKSQVRIVKFDRKTKYEDNYSGLTVELDDVPRFMKRVRAERGWESVGDWAARRIEGDASDGGR
jgi:hypothetical protein